MTAITIKRTGENKFLVNDIHTVCMLVGDSLSVYQAVPNGHYTYEAWQEKGYQVRKGERHKRRDIWGRPLFSASQVKPAIIPEELKALVWD